MSERLWEVEITWTATAYAWATSEAEARDMVNADDVLGDAGELHRDARPVDRKPTKDYSNHPVYSDTDSEFYLDVSGAWALQEAQQAAAGRPLRSPSPSALPMKAEAGSYGPAGA